MARGEATTALSGEGRVSVPVPARAKPRSRTVPRRGGTSGRGRGLAKSRPCRAEGTGRYGGGGEGEGRGPLDGVYDASTFHMMEKEERPDGSRFFRFVGGQKSGRTAKSQRRVHFVGIGGAGLSNLASLALSRGWLVTGSDVKDGPRLDRLREAGALVAIGHAERNVLGSGLVQQQGRPSGSGAAECTLPDAIVISSAVSADNVEVRSALKYNVPLYKRGAWLGRVTKGHDAVAMAGTHGKTTTSAMMALVLERCYGSVTAIVGGEVGQFSRPREPRQDRDKEEEGEAVFDDERDSSGWEEGEAGASGVPAAAVGTGSLIGSSNWFVLEADEYDRAFLDLQPKFAMVTNVELDHLDIYETEEDLLVAFDEFVDRVAPEGCLVVCGDDPGCVSLAERRAEAAGSGDSSIGGGGSSVAAIHTYGLGPENEWRATEVRREGRQTSFQVEWKGVPVGKVEISLLGTHNVLNALGVISLACEIALSEAASSTSPPSSTSQAQVQEGKAASIDDKVKECVQSAGHVLQHFQGVDRRCQVIGEKNGCLVISDYAHHPTEVTATLEAVASHYEGREVIVVFEPHTLSRLAYFFSEFVAALSPCERVYITEVFEPVKTYINKKVKDAITEDLAAALPLSANSDFVSDRQTLMDAVAKSVAECQGDMVVLVLGAGNSDAIAKAIFSMI
mmetsp:Transcript_10431/g.21424  ORF Transcript_10431/g.21424 Transcript_10431/m.21424 type:complete len:678 (-) Transcript_10431:117-2150(-)